MHSGTSASGPGRQESKFDVPASVLEHLDPRPSLRSQMHPRPAPTITPRLPQSARRLLIAGLVIAGGLTLGCTQAPKPSPFTGFYRGYDNCREQYAEMDARVAEAGVRDAEFYRVPGHPYLRTDRLLATFRNQVSGLNEVNEWIRRMREMDQDSRDFEYANLGIGELEASLKRDRFLNCGRVLASIELQDPQAWARLQAAVVPRDAYSEFARFLGLHALRIPGILRREADHRAQLTAEQTQDPAISDGAWREWVVKPVENLALMEEMASKLRFNELGFPALFGSQWRALVESHAPHLWFEAQAKSDGPAAPVWTPEGLAVDASRPMASYQIGYTRLGTQLLVQISYTFWFRSDWEQRSAPLDGLVWRVTLDQRLEPLTYESVHPSGRDHRWYPVQAMQLRPDAQVRESFVSPELAPARQPALLIEEGTHRLRRVAMGGQRLLGERGQFELRPYEDLYTLPLPEGGTRSLFGPDGLIAHGRGRDEVAGWFSGIRRPGVPRQTGHHAIGYVDRRHFDDPDLLDATFVAPPHVEGTAALEPGPSS